MLIDCDQCSMRDRACDDCVIGVLLRSERTGHAPPPQETAPVRRAPVDAGRVVEQWPGAGPLDLDETECRALRVLMAENLIPPLRLTTGTILTTDSDEMITRRGRLAG